MLRTSTPARCELAHDVESRRIVMTEIQQLVQSSEPAGIGGTLDNVRVMSENLRDLTETLRSYPSLLLLGEPPPETGKEGK